MKWVFVAIVITGALAPRAAQAQDRGAARIRIVQRGWLGVSYTFEVESVSGRTTRTTQSMSVDDVVEGSPAWKAGLRAGDEIVRIDGDPVTAPGFELVRSRLEPGDTVRLRVSREGRERDVVVVATERPAEYRITDIGMLGPERMLILRGDSLRKFTQGFMDSAFIRMDSLFADSTRFGRIRFLTDRFNGLQIDTLAGGAFHIFADTVMFPGRMMRIHVDPFRGDMTEMFPKFDVLMARPGMAGAGVAGAEFTEINPNLAHYFGTNKGLLVLRVGPGTPAARAGLEEGDVVTKAGGRVVEDVEDFRSTVARGSTAPLRLEVLRKGKTRTLDLTVARPRD